MALLARSGVGRDINRHYYARAEIDTALQRPVVQDLLDLIRLRNRHPAFGGTFGSGAGDGSSGGLSMRWTAGAERVALEADTAGVTFRLSWTTSEGERSVTSVRELAGVDAGVG